MRRFTRTPYFKGPEDPERQELRGTLQLGETVVVETVGGHDRTTRDGRLLAGDVMEVRRPPVAPGGFFIETSGPDWVHRDYRHGGGAVRVLPQRQATRGSIRLIAPGARGPGSFPPDFAVPIRPMIGYICLSRWPPLRSTTAATRLQRGAAGGTISAPRRTAGCSTWAT